ncbi:MAG: urea ABC transporter permease subunit UrtB [Alphaproteobacteria bacterium]
MSRSAPIKPLLALAFLVLALCLVVERPAAADPLAEGIDALAGKSFKKKLAAIDSLAATGDVRAVPVLRALLDGKMFVRKADGKVVIAERKGRVYVLGDPLAGTEIGEGAKRDIKKIRINNKMRGAIRAALGGLTLLSPDRAQRLEAARAVFKAREPDALPLLEKALARETDDDVRAAMLRARAATALFSATETGARSAALGILADSATPEVRALLSEFLADVDTGAGPELRAAAQTALDKIEDRLALWEFVADLFRGISLGSVLLLAAVGLAITFGVMGVINMAHGELIMLGAYTTFVVQELFRAYAPEAFDWSVPVAIPAAFLVAGGFGIAIERGIIRHLYGRPLETLLATWGLSLVLQQLVRSFFGPTNREVGAPSWMSGAIEVTGGLVLTYNRIWIIVFSLAVILLLAAALRKTAFGLQMRAVTQNRRMAGSMGIRTGRVDALTFGLGSGIAGMAGVALSQIDNVSPNLGQTYLIDSFLVVVFGGVGNLWGTLVGAFSLGLVNKFLEPVTGAVLGKILVLVAIILFIQRRPRGLFALKGRAIEQ